MEPLISIVIPIYNAEHYLCECLNSVVSQKYSNFELILINDGSTDDSASICIEYANKDNRIKFIEKVNSGVSSTRNIGIREAKGKYLTFIDSDDYIQVDFLSQLVDNIDCDIDMVQSGLYFFEDGSGEIIGEEILPVHDFLNRDNVEDCFTMATLPLITSPVSKLYNVDILKKHRVLFNEVISYGEDRDFNLRYLGVAKNTKSISYCGYFYRKGIPTSLSRNQDYLTMMNIDLKYWKDLKLFLYTNKCIGNVVDKYLVNRIFNIYNDRLTQYTRNSGASFTQLMKTVRNCINTSEYEWFIENNHLVDCNRFIKIIYKSYLVSVIAFYLKLNS